MDVVSQNDGCYTTSPMDEGAENAFFGRHLYTKNDHFAKTGLGQTRRKLRANVALPGDGGVSGNGAPDPSAYPHYLKMQRALLATGRDIGKKTVFFVSTQLIMMKERITLPRQARDKRRVNSKKRSVFLQSTTSKGCPAGAAARAWAALSPTCGAAGTTLATASAAPSASF
eukprot:COSAG06_NODE_6512_length_2900_cov_2.361657_5_plen_171_part_00